MRRNPYAFNAGLIMTRRSRRTGRANSVYDAVAAGLDATAGAFATVCEDHGTIANHRTQSAAIAQLSSADWCAACQAGLRAGTPVELAAVERKGGRMLVTGFKLLMWLRQLAAERDAAYAELRASRWVFPDEAARPGPVEIAARVWRVEERLAKVNAVQDLYNATVECSWNGRPHALGEAVALLGSVGRLDKFWREYANDEGGDRYGRAVNERAAGTVRAFKAAEPVVSLAASRSLARLAAQLRELIARGNQVELEVPFFPVAEWGLAD